MMTPRRACISDLGHRGLLSWGCYQHPNATPGASQCRRGGLVPGALVLGSLEVTEVSVRWNQTITLESSGQECSLGLSICTISDPQQHLLFPWGLSEPGAGT